MPIEWLIRDLVRVGAPIVFSLGLLWGMRGGYVLMHSGGDVDDQREALQDLKDAAWTCLLAGMAWGLGGFLTDLITGIARVG
jgi:hypothetical protein